jgi:hypothetical protein
VHDRIQFAAWNEDKIGDVMANKGEAIISSQMGQVFSVTGNEVVHANHFMTFFEHTLTKVRAQETSCSSDENSHNILSRKSIKINLIANRSC